MLTIGLTGGIGCGKSAVARLFEKRSIPVVDADRIAHALVEPGQPALAAIVEAFGAQVLEQDDRLDRVKLRQIVFASPEHKFRLESILHPLVYQRINEELADLDAPYCIVCVPLLFETRQQHRVDRVLVVDCSVELQYERVAQRDRMAADAIERILKAQVTREERLKGADDILTNESTFEQLDKQVEKLHNFYLALSEQTGFSH